MPRKQPERTPVQMRAKMLHEVLLVACHLSDELEILGCEAVAAKVIATIDTLWNDLDPLLHPDEQCPK